MEEGGQHRQVQDTGTMLYAAVAADTENHALVKTNKTLRHKAGFE